MLPEYVTSLVDVRFHIVGLHVRAVSVFGKKSDSVCGFLAYFCAVLRFSDPPYAPLLRTSTGKRYLPWEYEYLHKCSLDFAVVFGNHPNDPNMTVYCAAFQVPN